MANQDRHEGMEEMEKSKAKRRARHDPIRVLEEVFRRLEGRPSLATLEFWGLTSSREQEEQRDKSPRRAETIAKGE
jgi:hypothetical protein